jgi:hypothetical protein
MIAVAPSGVRKETALCSKWHKAGTFWAIKSYLLVVIYPLLAPLPFCKALPQRDEHFPFLAGDGVLNFSKPEKYVARLEKTQYKICIPLLFEILCPNVIIPPFAQGVYQKCGPSLKSLRQSSPFLL